MLRRQKVLEKRLWDGWARAQRARSARGTRRVVETKADDGGRQPYTHRSPWVELRPVMGYEKNYVSVLTCVWGGVWAGVRGRR